ncbi:MAG: dihydropteroate synthase [Verrucomicrobia bacterium]|nr:dihydropteroate synthase [Verrucomicrobiota bacterium]
MNLIPAAMDFKLTKNAGRDKENINPQGLLRARERTVNLQQRPLIMGILNINDDSFSSDGKIDTEWALARAIEMVAEGADIIDVGGESARTNREAITEEEELRRVRPFLENFQRAMKTAVPRDADQLFPPLLSLNTWRRGVVEGALGAGFDILNDMSALPDATNARLCTHIGAALLIMHSRGEPKVRHTHVTYPDVMSELMEFFEEKTALAMEAGVPRESVILDPGIDFAKQVNDNLRIFRELGRLTALGFPVLLPVSRKSVIGRVLGIEKPANRDAGTMACIVAGTLRGAAIFRVHNVSAAWFGVRSVEALR